MSNSLRLPFTHQRRGATPVASRSCVFQFERLRRGDVLAVDHQRRLRHQIGALVAKIGRVGRSDVVPGRADEDDVPAPLGARHLREVFGQREHHRDARRVVERGVEPAVHVRQHDDVLVRRARQRAVDALRLQAGTHLRRQAHLHARRTGRELIAQQLAVLESDPEGRESSRRGVHGAAEALPDRVVVVVAPDANQRGRAGVLGAADRALEHRRLPHLPWREHRVNDRPPCRARRGRRSRPRCRGPPRPPRDRARRRSAPTSSAGSSVLKVCVLPPPVAVRLQSIGNHCGGRSNSLRWMSLRPRLLNFASIRSPVITSYFVPAIRPQYLLPSSRLRRGDRDDVVDDRLHAAAVDVGVLAVGRRTSGGVGRNASSRISPCGSSSGWNCGTDVDARSRRRRGRLGGPWIAAGCPTTARNAEPDNQNERREADACQMPECTRSPDSRNRLLSRSHLPRVAAGAGGSEDRNRIDRRSGAGANRQRRDDELKRPALAAAAASASAVRSQLSMTWTPR